VTISHSGSLLYCIPKAAGNPGTSLNRGELTAKKLITITSRFLYSHIVLDDIPKGVSDLKIARGYGKDIEENPKRRKKE